MDRRVLFGVGAVAALGAGLAVVATVGFGVPGSTATEGGPSVSADAPGRAGSSTAGAVAREPRRPGADPGPADEVPGASVERPGAVRPLPPPDTFAHVQVEHDRLMHEPLFDGVSAEDDPVLAAEEVEEVLEDVHRLAAKYWTLSKGSDPAARAESLQRAARLYERFVETLPSHAQLEPGEPGWGLEQREALSEQLRHKANGLREAADKL